MFAGNFGPSRVSRVLAGPARRSHFLSSFVKTNKVNKKTPYHTFPDTHEVFAKLHA